ncbi:MAG: M50 family metallopeptidase [Bacteroidota bacterium]
MMQIKKYNTVINGGLWLLYAGLIILSNIFFYHLLRVSTTALAVIATGGKINAWQLSLFSAKLDYKSEDYFEVFVFLRLFEELSGTIFSFFFYCILCYLFFDYPSHYTFKKRLKEAAKRPFQGFTLLSQEGKRYSQAKFYSLLTIVVIGYYFHWYKFVYRVLLIICGVVCFLLSHLVAVDLDFLYEIAHYLPPGYFLGIIHTLGLIFILRQAKKTVKNYPKPIKFMRINYTTILQWLLWILYTIVIIIGNQLLYVILHESSHALAILLCGEKILEIRILSPSAGYVSHTVHEPIFLMNEIFIAIAGVIGGFLFSFFFYFIFCFFVLSYPKHYTLKKRIQTAALKPFQGFSMLKTQGKQYSKPKFASLLTIVVMGYYLHSIALLYGCFPYISPSPFYFYPSRVDGDGYWVWFYGCLALNILSENSMRKCFIAGCCIGLILKQLALWIFFTKAYKTKKASRAYRKPNR